MFIASADSDDLAGQFIELAIDEPEPLRALIRYVELDACESGQVAADVPITEFLADDAAVCEVFGDLRRSRDHLRAVCSQRSNISSPMFGLSGN